MFAKELDELAQRKRMILLEADLHRSLVESECLALREHLDSMQTAGNFGRRWLLWGGAVAELLLARRRGGLTRWISPLLAAWRWVHRLQKNRA